MQYGFKVLRHKDWHMQLLRGWLLAVRNDQFVHMCASPVLVCVVTLRVCKESSKPITNKEACTFAFYSGYIDGIMTLSVE